MTVDAPVEVTPLATVASPMKPTAAKLVHEATASAQQSTDVAEKEPTADELKALNALPELRSAAESAFAAENFTEAVEKLSCASELLATAYGALSPKCAEILLMYGRALYKLAAEQKKIAKEAPEQTEQKPSIDGSSAEAGSNETTTAKEAPAEGQQTGEREQPIAGGDGEPDEEEEEEEDANEEKDDLQTAFEILDTARVILGKMGGDAAQKMLAETHMLLGDVSLEGENFPRAVSDLSSALETAMKVYPPTDRTIAYVRFKLANALEWDNSFDKAIEEVQKAVEVLKLRADDLASGRLTVSHDKDAEIKEIQVLIPDMEAKIKELKETPVMNTLARDDSLAGTAADIIKSRKADAAEFLAQRLAQSEAASRTGVDDCTGGLKRKADDAPVAVEDAKKMKEAAARED